MELFKIAAYVDPNRLAIDRTLYDYYCISAGHLLIVTSFSAN